MAIGRFVLHAALIVLVSGYIYSDEEAWVIFQKGKESFRKKEYGIALSRFKEALSVRKNYPEAEIAIGDIYAVSSEWKLAEEQYKKAYRLKSYFEYPEKVFVSLYRLADLYKQSRNNRLLEQTLLSILSENKDYYENVYLKYKDVFYRLFTSQGPDRLLVLYRIRHEQFALKAHLELAKHYYRHGRFEESTHHSLVALVSMITESIDELLSKDPLYRFKTLESYLDSAFQYKNIREYLVNRADIFPLLYYLGNSVYTLGKYAYAAKLWRIVATNKQSTIYRNKAINQLDKPVIEEYVDISPAKIDFIWDY